MADPKSEHSHNHHSHGHHAHQHANKEHWDKMASNYVSEPWQAKLVNDLTSYLGQQSAWMHPGLAIDSAEGTHPFRVLDYACGPGTFTAAVAKAGHEYTGLDLSANMAAEYNKRFAGEASFRAHAAVGNLLDTELAEAVQKPELYEFDLVATSLALHHIDDAKLALQRLAERARSGGRVVIVDLMVQNVNEQTFPAHIMAHFGFTEQGMRELMEGAGLKDFEFVMKEEDVYMKDVPVKLFLARATKP